MSFSENLESAKNFAVGAAQNAAKKTKKLAAIAKANLSIYAEEDKIKKAELQLGKLCYRDYALNEDMDSAEYLPWFEKIDESKKIIADLRDQIEDMKCGDSCEEEAPAAKEAEEAAPVGEEPAAEEPAGEPAEEAPVEIHIENAE